MPPERRMTDRRGASARARATAEAGAAAPALRPRRARGALGERDAVRHPHAHRRRAVRRADLRAGRQPRGRAHAPRVQRPAAARAAAARRARPPRRAASHRPRPAQPLVARRRPLVPAQPTPRRCALGKFNPGQKLNAAFVAGARRRDARHRFDHEVVRPVPARLAHRRHVRARLVRARHLDRGARPHRRSRSATATRSTACSADRFPRRGPARKHRSGTRSCDHLLDRGHSLDRWTQNWPSTRPAQIRRPRSRSSKRWCASRASAPIPTTPPTSTRARRRWRSCCAMPDWRTCASCASRAGSPTWSAIGRIGPTARLEDVPEVVHPALYLARRRGREVPGHAEEGRLAAARGADDGDELAAPQREAHSPNGLRAIGEHLARVAEGNDLAGLRGRVARP